MFDRYDTKKYYEIVEYIRQKMPDCAITSDIIVGFPGETEEDFEGTLNMLSKVEFDMLYSFIKTALIKLSGRLFAISKPFSNSERVSL